MYTGELGNFAGNHADYASGLADFPLAKTKWDANDTVTYKVRATLQDNNSANSEGATGYATSEHKYVWEARNQ